MTTTVCSSAEEEWTNAVDKPMDVQTLFSPRGVAVIGASENLSRIGGQPIRALLEAGYAGNIYPVNPKYTEVAGLRCHPQLTDIDGPCDLAIVAVPAESVPESIIACGQAGIRYAIVLSGGFREIGEGGAALEQRLRAAVRVSGVRVIGPNCQGLISTQSRLFAVFGAISHETQMQPGAISMVFQSGGFGFSVMTLCDAQGIQFRHCISTGNEADVTTPELVKALAQDTGTRAIFLYIEGIRDGRALIDAAHAALEAGKPVVVWKGGRTEVGNRAAASHTANMTGQYDLYRSAFRQAGMIEVKSVNEIVDLFKLISTGRQIAGGKLAALAISGGAGVVFADAAIDYGAQLPVFTTRTIEKLRELLPTFASAENPVDITADIFNDISRFTSTLKVVLGDPNVDQLAILLASLPGTLALDVANAIVAAQERSAKPIVLAWSARRARAVGAYDRLETAQIPILPSPERVGMVTAILANYAEAVRAKLPNVIQGSTSDIAHKTPCGQRTLNEIDAKHLLMKFGIPVTNDVVIAAASDPTWDCRDLTYPVVAKIISSAIPHKSDIGGVKVNLSSPEALRRGVEEILDSIRCKATDVQVDGVLVSSMVTDGVEAIVGIVNDAVFGPTVALGLGGVFTEILHDVTYRVAPFTIEVARTMIADLRSRALLEGARGTARCDTEALADTLVRLSNMAWELRDGLVELDINPLFIRPVGKGVIAADCLITLSDGVTPS